MNNWGTLYHYEMKKLLKRKIVWITLLACLVITGFSIVGDLIGSYYLDNVKIDTNYHMLQTDLAYQKALNGKKIDQTLLEEMAEGYRQIPKTANYYRTTEEYQKYARPYSIIFGFVRTATEMTVAEAMEWIPNENELYNKRLNVITGTWKESVLSENEQNFWLQKESEFEIPFTFQVTEGYYVLFRVFPTIGLLVLLSVAICISSVFTEEHTRKTDQLILCSTHGKNAAYWVKILTGISFAVGISLVISIVAFALTFIFYGYEGFDAAFQLVLPSCSYPITAGEATLIMYGILIITAVLTSISVMILSERLRSNIATLAIASGFLILGMVFNIPSQYRIFSQIWNWLPNCILYTRSIFDVRLLSAFGRYFTSWQAVPIIYLIVCVVIVIIGKPIYKHFEVSGR